MRFEYNKVGNEAETLVELQSNTAQLIDTQPFVEDAPTCKDNDDAAQAHNWINDTCDALLEREEVARFRLPNADEK